MASTSSEKEAREDHTLEMREEAKEMRMEQQLAEKTVRRTSNMKTRRTLTLPKTFSILTENHLFSAHFKKLPYQVQTV